VRTDSRAPVPAPGYADGRITKPPEWHGLVAWDMLLNNLSTGLFLVAAVGELAAPSVFAGVARAAYPLALVLLLADLVCLVLDLGDPLRFHHMLRVFKPTSPMSLGVWGLSAYSLPLTAVVAIDLLADGSAGRDAIHALLLGMGVVAALVSAVYKGVLFSVSAQPGWRDARWLGGYLTSAAVLLGCAEMLALSVLLGHERAAAVLRPALVLLLVLNAIPLGLLIANLLPALVRVYGPRHLLRVGILGLGGARLLPLGLLLAGGSPPLVLVAVLSLVLGGLAIRDAFVKLPHHRPPTEARRPA
jgi:hypothetical protein